MSSRPPVRPGQKRPSSGGGSDQGFWARWWARPANKARVILPFLLILFYFFFLRN